MLDSKTAKVLESIKKSPQGIITLDILESLRLCGRDTLKTILSRLHKAEKIVRLKRGVYATFPLQDAFAAAQSAFGGYLGFSTALYLQGLISEMPFTLIVVTPQTSASKNFGQYKFKAVALKEKAIGLETKGKYVVSSRPKTFFDCLYLPEYSVEPEKLLRAFQEAHLTKREWKEFDYYLETFVKGTVRTKFYKAKKAVRGKRWK